MKKIIDNIIFVLGALLLIIAIGLKDNYQLMLSIAAVLVTIIGILLFINKSNFSPIVLPIGISLAASVILYRFTKIPLYKITILFFTVSLFLILLITMIIYHLELKQYMKTHKMIVSAKIIDLIKNPNTEKDIYYPVLSYVINGDRFEINYPFGYVKNIPNIDDTIEININPNDYLDVYFKPSKKTILKNYMSCIAVFVLEIIVWISLIK